jgi:hydrogenase-4 component D
LSEPALVWFAALVGIPLAGALLALLLRGRPGDVAAVAASALTALVTLGLVARHGLAGVSVPLGGSAVLDRWVGRPVALFGFALDPLSSVVLLGASLIGFACVLHSTAYVGPANRELPASADRRVYWAWLLAFVAAMGGLVTSATLFQLFVFWEVTTVCSWALIGFYDREPGAIAAAQKAFLMTAAGGLCLFVAVVVLVAVARSSDFSALGGLPAGLRGTGAVLASLMLVGAWAKSAQVPFHTWLPSAMVAPSPVSAYLHAASMVNAGVYLVLRVVLANAPAPVSLAALERAPGAAADIALPAAWIAPPLVATGLAPWLPAVIGGMALVTLVVAVAQFFYQDDLKRLLALSTISHLALGMLGASLALAGATRAAQGATLHILAHGVGKGLLFLAVGTLGYSAGTRHIRSLSGVLQRAPVAAVAFLVGALTVTGVPPFAGFWSKLLLVSGAVGLGGWGVAVGAIVVVESVVAFAWFLWVGQRVCLGPPSPAVAAMAPRPAAMEASLIYLMVLCLAVTAIGLPLALAVRPGPFGG